jgi:hypothetical protein
MKRFVQGQERSQGTLFPACLDEYVRLLSRPDFSDAEKMKFEELMRKAGFPVCAKPEELVKYAQPLRLPECAQ